MTHAPPTAYTLYWAMIRAMVVKQVAHWPRTAGRLLGNRTGTPSTNSRRSRQRGQKACSTPGWAGDNTGGNRRW